MDKSEWPQSGDYVMEVFTKSNIFDRLVYGTAYE